MSGFSGNGYWRPMLWWLPILTLALLLKQHYSITTESGLQWMLQPLADLLEILTGHDFQRKANAEWISVSADVRLVKGCAGINFMIMSLLAYGWVFRPDRREQGNLLAWLAGQLPLLAAVVIAAWATTLLANSLRIIVAMSLQTDANLAPLAGFNGNDIHRMIGLAVYLPLLSLQLLAGKKVNRRQVFVIPAGLYLLLMVIVPLLTGNGLRNPTLFIQHLWQVLAAMVIGYGLYFLATYWAHRPSRK